jgi:hypothetical protein
MRSKPSIRALVGVAAVFTAFAGVTTAGASEGSGHQDRASKAQIPQTDCFWTGKIASKFSHDPAENYAFPDSGAVYWTAKVTMPPGSKLLFHGKFAHARYESFNTYNTVTNAPTDALNDVSTKPDKGSKNPFLPGAKRDTKNSERRFTVNVLNEQLPAAKATNTLYAGVPGQADQRIVLRVYEPDSFKAKELTGGVGLPKASLMLADGTVVKGQAACDTLQAQTGPLAITTLPSAFYASLRDQPGKPATFPAELSPVFRTYYNTGFIISCWYNGSCGGTPARTGGQYSNIDNQYVAAFVNRGFAEGPVLVLKGKLPTTPQTGLDVKRMGNGQMRYWSICQNESLYTTVGAGCLYDAQIPVDKHGNYMIITSTAADRPKNAKSKCGVGYIPWPAAGDGAGHLDDGLLIVRNMLPSSSFDQAIQNTATPGDEAGVMGPYLPRGTYTTKAAFEQEGC